MTTATKTIYFLEENQPGYYGRGQQLEEGTDLSERYPESDIQDVTETEGFIGWGQVIRVTDEDGYSRLFSIDEDN